MALNYKPLWIQLIKKDLMKVDIIKMAGLTTREYVGRLIVLLMM